MSASSEFQKTLMADAASLLFTGKNDESAIYLARLIEHFLLQLSHALCAEENTPKKSTFSIFQAHVMHLGPIPQIPFAPGSIFLMILLDSSLCFSLAFAS
jgi:hypothetical protein